MEWQSPGVGRRADLTIDDQDLSGLGNYPKNIPKIMFRLSYNLYILLLNSSYGPVWEPLYIYNIYTANLYAFRNRLL